MRTRLVLAATVLGAVSLLLPSAVAGPVVLDGKKTKKLTLTATATQQAHDQDFAGSDGERVDCEPPRCATLPFIYQPAKGVKGDVLFTLTWSGPVSDFDLYIASVDKKRRTQLATCGAATGNREKVFLSAGTMKKGKPYLLIVDFYRTPGETVTATAEMPGQDTVAKTLPEAADGAVFKFNCAL